MEELINVDRSSLRRFLVRWYGMPDLPVTDGEMPSHVPLALREWHRLGTSWSKPITVMNKPVPLGDLIQIENKTVFWEEAQGGQVWGFERQDDEANAGVMRSDPNTYPMEWTETEEDIYQFLLHATVFEAVWNSDFSITAHDVDPMTLADMLKEFDELSLPRWSWPAEETRLLVDSENLALVLRRRAPEARVSSAYVVLSSQSLDAINYFLRFSVDWQRNF
ncbi:hypothetical protein ACN3XK_72420 [Actinomadura welshii]